MNRKNISKPPLLSKVSLDSFVTSYADKKDRYMNAIAHHGSPLYILETDVLAERAGQFKKAFENRLSKVRCYYAMKSNNLPLITTLLVQNGFGIDVSSGIELSTALSNGAGDIIFSGPGKTEEELELAIRNTSKVTILVDSFGELEKIKKILKTVNETISVGVRLNSNPSGLWRKFGIPLDRLQLFYSEIKSLQNINLKGLQFHSSWNLEPGRQIEFIKHLGSHLKTVDSGLLDSIEFVDIGGGYWPQQGEWLVTDSPMEHYHLSSHSIDAFAEELARVLKDSILNITDCTICLEPGRWICNDAMHILMQVIDKKEDDMVITDAGTNIIGWERFETDYFPVINLSNFEAAEHPCHILGSLCTPHDVWGYAYYGKSISEGDVLMVPTQGAYTYSLKQQFIKPLPKVVVMENPDLVINAESHENENELSDLR